MVESLVGPKRQRAPTTKAPFLQRWIVPIRQGNLVEVQGRGSRTQRVLYGSGNLSAVSAASCPTGATGRSRACPLHNRKGPYPAKCSI